MVTGRRSCIEMRFKYGNQSLLVTLISNLYYAVLGCFISKPLNKQH